MRLLILLLVIPLFLVMPVYAGGPGDGDPDTYTVDKPGTPIAVAETEYKEAEPYRARSSEVLDGHEHYVAFPNYDVDGTPARPGSHIGKLEMKTEYNLTDEWDGRWRVFLSWDMLFYFLGIKDSPFN